MTFLKQDRRGFLAGSAAVLASAPLARSARGSAVDRLSVAVIGTGSRGLQVMNEFLLLANVQVVAVCDVHNTHYRDNPWGKGPKMGAEPAQAIVNKHYASNSKSGSYAGCDLYRDYRDLLGRADVDAVVVATPDHWHARITIDAVRSGKDVYCEKPVTHFFAEGQAVVRAVAKHNAVLQVGSQQRSDPLFRRAVELVRNRVLGKITHVEVGLPPGYNAAMDATAVVDPPDGLDYDLWCGPAPKLPYMRARHHRWWRSTRAFGGGVLMDWIGHHNDIAHWALDQDKAGPTRVEAVGWTASQFPLYDTPHEYEIRCTYEGDIQSRISTKVEGGTKWIGEDGWLWVNRGKIAASNPEWLRAEFKPGSWTAYRSDNHVENFIECIQSRSPCVTSAEIGHRSITPGHLGYVSHELGRPLVWDASQESVVNDAEAQDLLMQAPYRTPWDLS